MSDFLKNLYNRFVLVEEERENAIPEISGENVDAVLKDNPLTELFGNLFGNWVAERVDHLLMIVNALLPEITTLAIIICAIFMMFSEPNKWFGRALMAFFTGSILIII